jgi:hypothetical protein
MNLPARLRNTAWTCLSLACVVAAWGCASSGDNGGGDEGGSPDSTSYFDTGPTEDTSMAQDTGGRTDTGAPDAGADMSLMDAAHSDGSADVAVDRGRDTSTTSDAGAETEPPTDASDDSPGEAGAADCGSAATLFPETTAGVYCPFSSVDGGPNVTCAAGDFCCQPNAPDDAGVYLPSTCEAPSGACPVRGSIVWECEGPKDCAVSGSAGPVCCGFGTPKKEAPSCSNYNYVSGASGKGTVCAASCGTGQTQICDKATGECPRGTTCTPVKYHGNDVGYCM